MAAKESTTTQPGDFHDRYERLLTEARAALRRSGEARASSLRLPPAELTEEQRGSEGARHSKNNNEEAHSVPFVSRAPKPPSPIRYGSWRPPELIKQPRKLPTDYPDTLSLRTLAVINEAREKCERLRVGAAFPRRSQLLDFCKEVLAKLTPDFYGEVQAARLQGPQAVSHLDGLLDSLLLSNEYSEPILANLGQELKRSKEWAAFIRELSRAEQQARHSPQSSGEVKTLKLEQLQVREEAPAARPVAKDRKKRRVTERLDAETFHGYLRTMKEEHPKMTVREMCVEVDRLPANARTPPRKSWQAKSQRATWAGNYDHPKTKSSVKNFYSTVLRGNTPA